DRYAQFITGLEGYAEIRKAESKRLEGLAKRDANKASRLRKWLENWMGFKSLRRVETSFHCFSLQAAGGMQAMEIDEGTDPTKVDKCYQKTTVEFDKQAIRADLEAGISVPFARLLDRKESLRIK